MRRSNPASTASLEFYGITSYGDIVNSADYSDYELRGITRKRNFFGSGCYFLLQRAGNPDRKQDCNFPLLSRGRNIFHFSYLWYQLMSDNYSPDLLPCFTLDDSSE